MRRYAPLALLLLAPKGVSGQGTWTLYSGTSSWLDCRSTPVRTVLPTAQQWGGHSVAAITGNLYLNNEALTEIPDGGFDACPYTAATKLYLEYNDITTVGARAFARLAALTWLTLQYNDITWLAPTSLDGLTHLGILNLAHNRLGEFYYGALTPMAGPSLLFLNDQEGSGDPGCGGTDKWSNDPAGIQAAIAACGSSGSPCSDCAVGCPADDPGPSPGECFPLAEPALSSGEIGLIVVGAYLGVAAVGAAAAVALNAH